MTNGLIQEPLKSKEIFPLMVVQCLKPNFSRELSYHFGSQKKWPASSCFSTGTALCWALWQSDCSHLGTQMKQSFLKSLTLSVGDLHNRLKPYCLLKRQENTSTHPYIRSLQALSSPQSNVSIETPLIFFCCIHPLYSQTILLSLYLKFTAIAIQTRKCFCWNSLYWFPSKISYTDKSTLKPVYCIYTSAFASIESPKPHTSNHNVRPPKVLV